MSRPYVKFLTCLSKNSIAHRKSDKEDFRERSVNGESYYQWYAKRDRRPCISGTRAAR